MQQVAEQIKYFDTENIQLPLGYKKIYLRKIPPFSIENKLMLYNNKYKFNARHLFALTKPISKILK